MRQRESKYALWNDPRDQTHTGAITEAAIVIYQAHAAVHLCGVTTVGAAWQDIDLLPITSIARNINPPNSVACAHRGRCTHHWDLTDRGTNGRQWRRGTIGWPLNRRKIRILG